MNLTFKNIAINAGYYALTVLVAPWGLLKVEVAAGVLRPPNGTLRGAALVVGFAGAALQGWCICLFQRLGRGTPSPVLPPVRFVTQGPYRWLRNPMNLGELAVFLALADWYASLALLAYTAFAGLAFHLFILWCEEPRLLQDFGHEYARYAASVNRWLPRAPKTELR
jgi:protein-S-isoprenylcysteine O-methyltransferase Ste14